MRDSRIDSVRLMCNLLIVVAHVYPFMYLPEGALYLPCFVCRYLALMAMPALFILSGYLLFQNYEASSYPGKMTHRILRLLVPLVIWNGLYIVAYNLLGRISPQANATAASLGINTLSGVVHQLSPVSKLTIGPFWYVRAILVFSFAAPVFLGIYRRVHWLVLFVVCIIATIFCDEILSGFYPMYGLGLFMMGGLLAFKKEDMIMWFAKYRMWLTVIGLAFLCGNFLINVNANEFVRQPSGIVKFMGVSVIWCFADYVHSLFANKFIMRVVMPAGFMIYALHGIVAQVLLHSTGKALCRMPMTNKLGGGGNYDIVPFCHIDLRHVLAYNSQNISSQL